MNPTPATDSHAASIWKHTACALAGLLAFEGSLSDGAATDRLNDVTVTTEFRKTPDPNVYVGAFVRFGDRDHYYAARFRNAHLLEILNSPKASRPYLLRGLRRGVI